MRYEWEAEPLYKGQIPTVETMEDGRVLFNAGQQQMADEILRLAARVKELEATIKEMPKPEDYLTTERRKELIAAGQDLPLSALTDARARERDRCAPEDSLSPKRRVMFESFKASELAETVRYEAGRGLGLAAAESRGARIERKQIRRRMLEWADERDPFPGTQIGGAAKAASLRDFAATLGEADPIEPLAGLPNSQCDDPECGCHRGRAQDPPAAAQEGVSAVALAPAYEAPYGGGRHCPDGGSHDAATFDPLKCWRCETLLKIVADPAR